MTIELAFNHVSLAVKNLEASVEFYSRVLGLRSIENLTRVPHIRWFSIGEGLSLHLIERSGPVSEDAPKATHFALATSRFDDALAHLKGIGIAFGDWRGVPGAIQVRADGARQVYFQDPDGHWIEFVDRA